MSSEWHCVLIQPEKMFRTEVVRARPSSEGAAAKELQRHRAFWHDFAVNGTPLQKRLVKFLGKAALELINSGGAGKRLTR